MTWIKICGNTNLEDARAAVDAGADAVGFVFAPSPRRITPECARDIVVQLPVHIEKVGVFANETGVHIREIVGHAGLTAAQLHWDVTLQFINDLHAELTRAGRAKVIRVLKVPALPRENLEETSVGWDPFGPGGAELDTTTHELRLGPVAALLLDTAGADGRGGTGMAFDWSAARPLIAGMAMAASKKVIVAGGLTPENVGEAIATLHPWGVDVCSGVEREHGHKDHAKLRAFVNTVRAADKL